MAVKIYHIGIVIGESGGPVITIAAERTLADPVDGAAVTSKQGLRREVNAVGWGPLTDFLAAVLAKANDGRYTRNDIVYAKSP